MFLFLQSTVEVNRRQGADRWTVRVPRSQAQHLPPCSAEDGARGPAHAEPALRGWRGPVLSRGCFSIFPVAFPPV